ARLRRFGGTRAGTSCLLNPHFPRLTTGSAQASSKTGASPVEELVDLGDSVLVVVDRKSTRLNSSHVAISYAVFCLKKKKLKNNLSARVEHGRLRVNVAGCG